MTNLQSLLFISFKFFIKQAEGHIVTCETITGEVYRGKLIEAEDNMNCQMNSVTVTYRDGRVANLENIYIRGSKIRYFVDSINIVKSRITSLMIELYSL